MQWSIELRPFIAKNGDRQAIDVGFSVLHRAADGTLPQIISYRYHSNTYIRRLTCACNNIYRRLVDGSEYSGTVLLQSSQSSALQNNAIAIDAGTLIVYFDNSYSWFKEKRIKYLFHALFCVILCRYSINIFRVQEQPTEPLHIPQNSTPSDVYLPEPPRELIRYVVISTSYFICVGCVRRQRLISSLIMKTALVI